VRSDPLDNLIQGLQYLRQVGRCDRQAAALLQRAEELRLHFVEERSARQRIQLLQMLRLLTRLEAVDRRQQELIGAR
jgi:hypothetical protein